MKLTMVKISGRMPMGELNRLEDFIRDMHDIGVRVDVAITGTAWLCPLCDLLSHNPNDVVNEYCGCCGSELQPKDCAHLP